MRTISSAHLVVEAIFWFHPLAWWLERKLAALSEEAADHRALAVVATGNPMRARFSISRSPSGRY
jgi:beta-lactamase regulating signal transducer with metallopeptidase domain